jgi:hypothetical protein
MAEIKAASHHHVAGEAASIGNGFRFPLSRNMRYCRWDTAEQQIACCRFRFPPDFVRTASVGQLSGAITPASNLSLGIRGASYGDTQPVIGCS